ncbi:MAG: ABC transporter permease [Tannerella sp.]|jgi:ABC-2 type transport system permease protein|nr:ABC transporter permease [Tannerella sp.]
MNKTLLIITREYLRRVRKKSFIIMTLLTPILITGLMFVPLWLATMKGDSLRRIAVIDHTGKYASLFPQADNYLFFNAVKSLDEYRTDQRKDLFAILSITDDLLENPKAAALYAEKQIPGDLSRLVNQVLSKQMETEKLASFQIPGLDQIINESRISFQIQTIKWGTDGSETSSSGQIALIIGMVSTMLIYMFIMMYGGMVMQGVMEEKTNRIVEIMVSSVSPFSLMMGKIIGIGLVGITQLILWGILTLLLMPVGTSGLIFNTAGGMDMASMQQGISMSQQANPVELQQGMEWVSQLQSFNFGEIAIFFVIFFVGGYLLYASLFAAVGSAINSPEDSQQFMAPMMIIMIFALYTGIYSVDNPDGPLAFWCSLIPFTSPIVMLMRIPYDIPLWEKLLSVTLLFATSVGFVWLSAKIYRVGILMYGKKPRLKEIIKWITYK